MNKLQSHEEKIKQCLNTIGSKHSWREKYNSDFERTGVRFYKCTNCGLVDDVDYFKEQRQKLKALGGGK